MTAVACVVCDDRTWAPLYRGLVRCARCGFVRAETFPSDEELARIYGAGYFQGDEYPDYLADAPAHVANARRRLRRLASVAGRVESLYEIGCAYGFGLRVAADEGMRVGGIDISSEAVRHAREALGLDVTQGRFDGVPLSAGQFQAYCMWDTLEHLAHPESYLAKVASLLPRGGWFFATTGDIGSRVAVHQGAGWRMIHPPTHLQYFSRDTMTRFLARHGLQTVRVEAIPVCRSVYGTIEGLRRFGRGPARAAADAAGRILPRAVTRRMRFWLDLGDIMLVCARA